MVQRTIAVANIGRSQCSATMPLNFGIYSITDWYVTAKEMCPNRVHIPRVREEK